MSDFEDEPYPEENEEEYEEFEDEGEGLGMKPINFDGNEANPHQKYL